MSVGVERRRGWGLNARGGRRETPAKVLKDRRSPRQRGRMGTSVRWDEPERGASRRAVDSVTQEDASSRDEQLRAFQEHGELSNRERRRRLVRELDRGVDLFVRRRLRRSRLTFHVLGVVPYEAMSGWSSKASVGVQRRRGRGLKPRGGRRETTAKVLKDRRSPRRRNRMGSSV